MRVKVGALPNEKTVYLLLILYLLKQEVCETWYCFHSKDTISYWAVAIYFMYRTRSPADDIM
jgi:hypothetical protein